ncbi:MAG: PQQ-binding-like beta-propeller repeat protein [Gemmatimonadota bacterium]
MTSTPRGLRPRSFGSKLILSLLLLAVVATAFPLSAQDRGTPPGEWRYWGADAWSTRFSPLDQIDADNFEELEVAWTWRGDNFGPQPDYILRSTPIYVDGILYTVAGRRRTVAAIDPATGETLWTFREPTTGRWEDSPRQNYGKGVAYAEVDGRGVIYIVTPALFLHALDAKTGLPIEGFGKPIPVEGFGDYGAVDVMADFGYPYDPYAGIDKSFGAITNSSPPIVVDGVVVIGSSGLAGMAGQSRIENVRGDIQAYDARTGEHLWTFHTVAQPGEFGHETWENDAWGYVGNANAWAPLSADLEQGIVYVPTDAPTNDVFGGFRPGDNLFGSSVVALNARTGERVWHFQTVHHDIFDWDNPVAPILVDITVDGERIPAVVQTTKQAYAYTFNRVTGEPVWPIVERPVPASIVPGEQASPTQPIPTRPAGYEMQGMTEDDLVDFTPELRRRALEIVSEFKLGPIFNPPIHEGNAEGYRAAILCPSFTGGTNIMGGTVMDPENGIMYVASRNACSAASLVPGADRDRGGPDALGRTIVDWVAGSVGLGTIDGIPVHKPPYGRITAIDMNTGEHLWWIPNGDTPERIRNHPLLEGVNVPNTGQASEATALVTRSLLMYGEGRGGEPRLHAVDKRTGETVGTIDIPAQTSTAPMTYMHDGVQYIVLPVAGGGMPGSLVALRLPG